MRRVTAAMLPKLESFLYERASIAMFPLTNLLEFGIEGEHRKAMTFWMSDDDKNVIAQSNEGMVMPIFTSKTVKGIQAALRGRMIAGVVGTQDSVAQIKAAFDLPQAALDRVEPHLALELDKLRMPDTTGLTLEPFTMAPRETLIKWRAAYYEEALEAPPEDATPRAISFIDEALESAHYRVLMKGDTPLALTGFNAVLPETVMIGGVYTPPEQRGKGYAGAAIALNLADARSHGVKEAVLSAANSAAARAYEKIGFQKMGEFGITVFENPVMVHG